MRWIPAIVVGVLAALAVSQLEAAAVGGKTQFRWTDAAGIPHYSDTLTQDALLNGYDVLNAKGAIVKHVDRQRTSEELLAAQAAAEAAAAAKREADKQALDDARMLAAYPTEHDLVLARQAQLDSIDHNIRSASNSLGVQERDLSSALATAAEYDHDKKPIPDAQKKQIEALRKSVDSLRAYIARRQQEKIDAAKKLDVDVAHYREARATAQQREKSNPP